MATSLLPDQKDDEKLNPSQSDYEGKVDNSYVNAGLDQLESFANDPDNASDQSVQDAENSTAGGGWVDNVSNSVGGIKKGQKLGVTLKGFIKSKGALAAILSVLGVGAAGITAAPAMLGPAFSSQIIERITGSAGFLGAADENILRLRLFGGSTLSTNCTIGRINCKFQGISPEDMDKMKASGVSFTPSDGKVVPNSDGKLVTFNSVEVNGVKLTASNFNSKINNPFLKRKLRPIYNTPIWSAMNNQGRVASQKYTGINKNPDTRATTKDELKSKVYAEVHPETGSNGVRSSSVDVDEDAPEADQDAANNKNNNYATGSAELSKYVSAAEEAAAKGDFSAIRPMPLGNIANALGNTGSYGTIEDTKSPLSVGWSWINSMDVADTLCTVYQLANTALLLARTVNLINTMRYGYIFLAAWQKQMAGESTPEETNQLMSVITTPNSVGQSFDSSPASQWLFTGGISNETGSSVSAVGGEAIQTLSNALLAINGFAGTVFGLGTNLVGTAGGRAFLSGVCGVATNLAVQIGVTVIDLAVTVVASVFSGGTYAAAKTAIQASLKTGLRVVKDQAVTIIKKNFMETVGNVFKRSISAAERKQARQNALRLVRKQALDPFNMAGLALLLVENFGMDFIVNTLAGTDVLGYMDDSSQTADAVITAAATDEYMASIASGGQVMKLDSSGEAYEAEAQNYIAQSVDMMKAEADPLDINNPYSMVGSFASSLSLQLGGFVDTSSPLSILGSVLRSPSGALSSFASLGNASATTKATNQDIANFVNDPFMQKRSLAVDIVGNPKTGADLDYIRETPADELLQKAIDRQYITPTGSPVSGSEYEKHVNDCNNPERTQLNNELLDDSVTMPASCYDGSVDRREFNAITTYRALLLEPSKTDGEIVIPVDPGYGPRGDTTDYGPRNCDGCSEYHRAIDLGNYPDGTLFKPVYAIADGEVILSGKGGTGGNGVRCAGKERMGGNNNTVWIRHSNGVISQYMHMGGADITVDVGDTVTMGQQIGKINNCGQSWGEHLHFSILLHELDEASYPDIAAILDPLSAANGGKATDPVQYYALYGLEI